MRKAVALETYNTTSRGEGHLGHGEITLEIDVDRAAREGGEVCAGVYEGGRQIDGALLITLALPDVLAGLAVDARPVGWTMHQHSDRHAIDDNLAGRDTYY